MTTVHFIMFSLHIHYEIPLVIARISSLSFLTMVSIKSTADLCIWVFFFFFVKSSYINSVFSSGRKRADYNIKFVVIARRRVCIYVFIFHTYSTVAIKNCYSIKIKKKKLLIKNDQGYTQLIFTVGHTHYDVIRYIKYTIFTR